MRLSLTFILLIFGLSFAVPASAFPVKLVFDGSLPDEVRDRIEDRLPENPDAETALQAQRQGRRAISIIKDILNAYGYFDPDISSQVTGTGDDARATLTITPGAQFVVRRLEIDYVGSPPREEDQIKARNGFTMQPGMAAVAAEVIDQERQIASALQSQGYAYAEVKDRNVIGDRDAKTISVTYRVSAGPRIRFGETLYPDGLRTKDHYLKRLNPMQAGEVFDASELALYNSRLSETRLFNTALAQLSDDPIRVEADGTEVRQIRLDLKERPRNTVTVGAGFDTAEGFGLDVELIRRNLTGRGDFLTATGRAAERELGLDLVWRRPNELGFGRGLSFFASVSDENTDAFDQQTGSVGVGVQVIEGPQWQYSAGAEARYIREDGESGRRDFQVLSVNGSMAIDRSDSLLDPRRGWRLDARIRPTYAFSPDGNDVPYIRAVAQGRAYIPLSAEGRFVAAGRLRIGTLAGASASDVPGDERFYSGGGGSVRGYAFQGIGPFDANDVPLGGRSLSEASLEGRARITDRIGAVAFIDAGSVSDQSYPDFDNLRVGAGVGVRYMTPAGPLRLDVATPLNPSERDDVIQVYISIGQAF